MSADRTHRGNPDRRELLGERLGRLVLQRVRGVTVPMAAVEICRQRLTPACFNRAVVIAEIFPPEDAVAAGFLDRVAPPEGLAEAAAEAAAELARLDLDAHAATKLRARRLAGTALREAIDADDAAYRARVAEQPAG